MPLTDTTIRQAKPQDKDYKLADAGGLFLLVKTNGSKYWRLKYRYAGKEKLLAIGVYPTISLKEARTKTESAKSQLRNGADPGEVRKLEKLSKFEAAANSFEAVGREWFASRKAAWVEKHWTKVLWMLEKNLFPWLGTRPISEITSPELLVTLRRIESRGAIETAKRVKQVAGQVFRFAVATGRAEHDPSQALRDALSAPVKKHLAAITDPNEVGPLLNAIDAYQGTPVVRAALRLAPLTFVRPGELRNARWEDINFDTEEWRYLVTKTKSQHIVPLSRQAIEILRELQPITGRSEYVFPSPRTFRRPLSDNAVLAGLRRAGIGKEEMCGHGFRAMARTILDEVLGYRVDWIEHQLAHAVRDANGRAYILFSIFSRNVFLRMISICKNPTFAVYKNPTAAIKKRNRTHRKKRDTANFARVKTNSEAKKSGKLPIAQNIWLYRPRCFSGRQFSNQKQAAALC